MRSCVTPATPSSRRTLSATSVENGCPTTLEMMNCEVSDFSRAASVLAIARFQGKHVAGIAAKLAAK